jgi:membrane associated rhomboid family serine protease
MNLRVFHIVFIGAATALFAWLGAFCLTQWRRGENGIGALIGGVAAFAAAGGLVVYGSWFLRKTRRP